MSTVMNDLQVFNNQQFGEVRSIEIDGEIWFVGKDIADSLGYVNAKKAIRDHVDEEDKQLLDLNTGTNRSPIQGNPNVVIINESGLYSLMLRSKLPAAKQFKRWITREVLPTIRKTGSYVNKSTDNLKILQSAADYADILTRFDIPKQVAQHFAIDKYARDNKIDLEDIKQLMPPADDSDEYIEATKIGKKIGISAQAVNNALLRLGYIYKNEIRDRYELTAKGAGHAQIHPFVKNGHSGHFIKYNAEWIDSIIVDIIDVNRGVLHEPI